MPAKDCRFHFGMWDSEPEPGCLGISNHVLTMAANQLVEAVATQWQVELLGEITASPKPP